MSSPLCGPIRSLAAMLPPLSVSLAIDARRGWRLVANQTLPATCRRAGPFNEASRYSLKVEVTVVFEHRERGKTRNHGILDAISGEEHVSSESTMFWANTALFGRSVYRPAFHLRCTSYGCSADQIVRRRV